MTGKYIETLIARMHIDRGWPPDEGAKLATAVLGAETNLAAIMIDLRGLPPAMLISCFYGGFFVAMGEHAEETLECARKITWITDFGFQLDFALRYSREFVMLPSKDAPDDG